MLVASSVTPFAQKIVFGDLKKLDEEIFQGADSKLNIENYRDEKIITVGAVRLMFLFPPMWNW